MILKQSMVLNIKHMVQIKTPSVLYLSVSSYSQTLHISTANFAIDFHIIPYITNMITSSQDMLDGEGVM